MTPSFVVCPPSIGVRREQKRLLADCMLDLLRANVDALLKRFGVIEQDEACMFGILKKAYAPGKRRAARSSSEEAL